MKIFINLDEICDSPRPQRFISFDAHELEHARFRSHWKAFTRGSLAAVDGGVTNRSHNFECISTPLKLTQWAGMPAVPNRGFGVVVECLPTGRKIPLQRCGGINIFGYPGVVPIRENGFRLQRDEVKLMEAGEQAFMIRTPDTEMENASAQLMARARDGDHASFDEIMILHQRRVFRTAYHILGHLQDAQDAAQEVFLRLFKYAKKYDRNRPLSPWLYRMTINVCHDIVRKRKTVASPLNEADAIPDGQTETIDYTMEKRMIAQGLLALPEKERAAIVLRDIEGLSTKEVAEALGSTETTVRSQISRARVKLKEFCDRIPGRQS